MEILTLTTVSISVQFESFGAIAFVHAVVQFVAELLARATVSTSTCNEKEENKRVR